MTLEERMAEVLRAYVGGTGLAFAKKYGRSIYAEACDIVSQLPDKRKASDPHELYARDLLKRQGWASEPSIGSEAVVRMIAMAHRREQGQ